MNRILILSAFFLFVGNLQAQDKVMDSLQNELANVSNDLDRAKGYNAISNHYKYSDPTQMLAYGNRAFQLAKENEYTIQMGVAYLNIGTAHIILGDYEKAMDHFVWAKTLFEKLLESDDSNQEINKAIARTYGSIGIVFSEQSNYSKALQYYLKAAKFYEEENDRGQASKIYNNIGVVYKSQGEQEKALEYFLEALKIQKIQQYPGIGITQTNIANIYFKQNKLDEAFQYYTAAKSSIDSYPNPRALGEWYNNIGAYYNSRKYPELAVENWQKAITTFKEFEDQFGLTDTYLHLGEFYLDQKHLKKALIFANEALDLALSIEVLEQIMVAEKLISDVHEKDGNSNLALEHFKKYSAAKDSLVRENDIRKEIEAVMNYEFEKKEIFRNEENKKRELLLIEEAKAAKMKLLFGGLLTLLLIGIGFLIYNRSQLKRTLTLQKELAEYEQKALHLQMNPHFVFNCLGSISSFIVQNGTDSAIKYLSKFSKLMRLTLEYSKESLIPIDREIESLQNYLELEQLRFDNKFNFQIIKGPNIEDDVALPPLLIQPFIENSIIHGVIPKKENGTITIEFSVTETSLNCYIVDDGIGINQSRKNKENLVLAHKSMALDIIKKRLEMIKEATSKEANIKIEEITEGDAIRGTKVMLQLPLQYINN